MEVSAAAGSGFIETTSWGSMVESSFLESKEEDGEGDGPDNLKTLFCLLGALYMRIWFFR